MEKPLVSLIKRILEKSGQPMTGREIADAIGRSKGLNQNDRQVLKDMAREGMIVMAEKNIGPVKKAYTYEMKKDGVR